MYNSPPETVWQPSQNVRPGSTKTLTSVSGEVLNHKQDTAKDKQKPVKRRRLTGKQKAFVKLIIDNPTTPLYVLAEQAGYTGSNETLRAIASENLTKPNIMHELQLYAETAETVMIEVMNYSKDLGRSGTAAGAAYASNARQAASDVLDRVHGKPTQRTEITKRSVTLNVDLTGVAGAGQDDTDDTFTNIKSSS